MVTTERLDRDSNIPLFQQVARLIRDKILLGELADGACLGPEHEMAQRLGVSLITTRKALKLLVEEGLIYRRRRLGTFVKAPGGVRRRGNLMFLLCRHNMPDVYYSRLFFAVEAACRQHGQNMQLAAFSGDFPALDHALAGRVDGVILTGRCDEKIRDHLQTRNIPLVLCGLPLDRPVKDSAFGCVVTDPHEYGVLTTNYLLETGRQRIGFLGGNPNWLYFKLLRKGYREALRAAKQPARAALQVGFDLDAATDEIFDKCLTTLLDAKPDALLCVSDPAALRTLKSLHDRGLRVPEDIAVVGIGNTPYGEFSVPSLTSLDLDIEGFGHKAGEMLCALTEGRLIDRMVVHRASKIVKRQSA